MMINFFGVKGW